MKSKTHVLVGTAMLSAVSILLTYFELSMPFSPSFAKMDFSDIPALLASFAYGPLSGVSVEAVKNLIGLLKSTTGGIGELANFIIGSSLVLPAGFFYRRSKTKACAILGMGAGCILMSIMAAIANGFLLLPAYSLFMPMDEIISAFSQALPFVHSKMDICLYSALPTTFFKGLIVSIFTLALYKRLSVFLKGVH